VAKGINMAIPEALAKKAKTYHFIFKNVFKGCLSDCKGATSSGTTIGSIPT